jgi:hypothetical protein
LVYFVNAEIVVAGRGTKLRHSREAGIKTNFDIQLKKHVGKQLKGIANIIHRAMRQSPNYNIGILSHYLT